LTPTYLRESNRGMAAVQQHITYKRELLAGDIGEIKSVLLGSATSRSGSGTICATQELARYQSFARSPAFTWTGRRGNPRRSPLRSARQPKASSRAGVRQDLPLRAEESRLPNGRRRDL